MSGNTLFQELEKQLRMESRYCTEDGVLLKNTVVEAALAVRPDLIKLLLAHDGLRRNFFTDVDGVPVFDKVKFQRLVMNKRFLPDSYTCFKNMVGLANEDDAFISESREVVLSWPFKDCILEGGQTKEDAKRDEVFWNEILAPDEINRLTEPKALTGFRRYDADGEHEVSRIGKGDNLIIKGNNLLALYSLRKRYAGKVKLIYIDPPYNTGGDSFGYNDSFRHSTWLTFMKNRLEVAKELLRIDGAIFVQIDHHELGYLNVLMDEIFGKENKVQLISIKTASPAGFKTVNPGPIDVTEYILFYTKHKGSFAFKKAYVPVGYNKNYNLVVDNMEAEPSCWTFTPIKQVVLQALGFRSEREAKQKYGNLLPNILDGLIAQYAYDNAEKVVSIRDPHKPTATLRQLLLQSKEVDHVIVYEREHGDKAYLYKGGALAFYSNKMQEIDNKKVVTELLTDFWSHISWAGIAKEGGVKLKNGKKPERLIKQIIEISTEPNDIVLDFHLGSGTTAAVAHKMNRHYIGIEQMDYIKTLAVERLRNVISGEQSGISKAVGWHGGGSFIYCELAKANQCFADEIAAAETPERLAEIWQRMQQTGFLSYKVDVCEVDEHANDFSELAVGDAKRFLMECLDKNMLYVPYSEMDSKEFGVPDADKKQNRQFYSKQ